MSKILVADDNEINRKMLEIILKKNGYEYASASNGKEVMEIVDKENISLIFMDCQMPEMNGYQATFELRRKGKTIPIVAVTGNSEEEDKEEAKKSGMDDHLSKPYKREDIEEILKKWLSN